MMLLKMLLFIRVTSGGFPLRILALLSLFMARMVLRNGWLADILGWVLD